ncbi:MAG: hypothetical protein JWP91_2908 [Fibrobacteres bacterium]|nr:hypothetical protein [Fibrobacterota bacterium]
MFSFTIRPARDAEGPILERAAAAVMLGAGLMYFMDPRLGHRRRAQTLGRIFRMVRAVGGDFDRVAADFAGRAQGVVPRFRHWIGNERVADPVLKARIRAMLGHRFARTHSIHVESRDGTVTLSGRALPEEAGSLVSVVRRVPGVKEVEDRLETHGPEILRAGERNGHRRHGHPDFLGRRWPPAARFSAIALGSSVAFTGIGKGGLMGSALTVAGVGLVLRGLVKRAPMELLDSAGADIRRRFGRGMSGLKAWAQPRSFQSDTPMESL